MQTIRALLIGLFVGALASPVLASSETLTVTYTGIARWLHNYADATADGMNTFLGYNAGNFTLGPAGAASYFGSRDTGIGRDALHVLTTGNQNTCVGSQAGFSMNTGTDNTCIGQQSMLNLTTGSFNTAIGSGSLYVGGGATGDGWFNTAIGNSALRNTGSGSRNTALGHKAGYTGTTANANMVGSDNTWIGYQSGPVSPAQLDNAIAIGSGALSTKSNQAVLGNGNITETVLRGNVINAPLAAPIGQTYFVCVDDAGVLRSQASACQ